MLPAPAASSAPVPQQASSHSIEQAQQQQQLSPELSIERLIKETQPNYFSEAAVTANKRTAKKIMWADVKASDNYIRACSNDTIDKEKPPISVNYASTDKKNKSKRNRNCLDNDPLLKPKKWKKNPFCKGIVDGIREEDYRKYRIGIKDTPYPSPIVNKPFFKRRKFLSRSRPSSPVQKAECGIDVLNSSGLLYRSQSMNSIATISDTGNADNADCCSTDADSHPQQSNNNTSSNVVRGGGIRDTTDHSPLHHMHTIASLKRKSENSRQFRQDKRRQLVKMNSFDNNDASADAFDGMLHNSKSINTNRAASDDLVDYNFPHSKDGLHGHSSVLSGRIDSSDLSRYSNKSSISSDGQLHNSDKPNHQIKSKINSQQETLLGKITNDSSPVPRFSIVPLHMDGDAHPELYSTPRKRRVNSATSGVDNVSTSSPQAAAEGSEVWGTPCHFESLLQSKYEKVFSRDIKSIVSPISSYVFPDTSDFKDVAGKNDSNTNSKLGQCEDTSDDALDVSSVNNCPPPLLEKPLALHTSESCHNLSSTYSSSRVGETQNSFLQRSMPESRSAHNLTYSQGSQLTSRLDQDEQLLRCSASMVVPTTTTTTATDDTLLPSPSELPSPENVSSDEIAVDNSEDLSPIYEECSNLESSIAKLR